MFYNKNEFKLLYTIVKTHYIYVYILINLTQFAFGYLLLLLLFFVFFEQTQVSYKNVISKINTCTKYKVYSQTPLNADAFTHLVCMYWITSMFSHFYRTSFSPYSNV